MGRSSEYVDVWCGGIMNTFEMHMLGITLIGIELSNTP